jgi:RNA polymerase sigma-70 factor (ECF subfamily)
MTIAMPASEEMIGLIQPLVPALRRYARAMLADCEDADDLVQDVLERAVQRWHQRRYEASVRSWLFAILHNLAIDRLRRRARLGGQHPIDDVPEDRLAIPPDQQAAIHHADLQALVSALAEEQRAVLLLIAVEDMTYAEVAAVLDIPVGTVMSRLSRGRERLRRMIADGGRISASPRLRSVK